MRKIFNYLWAHKWRLLVLLLVVAGGSYWYYARVSKNTNQISYNTATVSQGTITVSVSGTGQVSVSNQVDIKPKVSGDIIKLAMTNGQEIKAGALLVQLDTREAQKAVRDAQANLESAKLSLQKLIQPADQLSVLQAENSLSQSQESKQRAVSDLSKAYDDGFNAVANTFLDLPKIMAGLYEVLLGSTLSGGGQWNKNYYADAVKTYDESVSQYSDDAYAAYQSAHTAYNKNFSDYKSTSRSADTATIESLLDETYETTKVIAEAVKSSSNLVQFYKDKLTERGLRVNSQAGIYLDNLNTYTGQAASSLINLLSVRTTIETKKQSIVDADRSIAEKAAALAKIKAGPDPLDIRSQELTIKQRENALLDAQEKLANYFIRAPFDGMVADVNAKIGEVVSSGTAIATLITNQPIADISLNEVELAKIKLGQKAILTFDAVNNLSLAGQVVDIATIGIVNQGVVSYNVKIAFATQDERIKTGMSVAAAIITDVKQDVLLVPNLAVKSQSAELYYVEILTDGQPRQQVVQIGISNDTTTEISGDVKAGEAVITQTISSNNSTTSAPQRGNSLIPIIRTGGFR